LQSGLAGSHPFITVTPEGEASSGLGPYGFNTPGTRTAGIQEALDAAIPAGGTVTSPTVLKVVIKAGIYKPAAGIAMPSQYSVIEGAGPKATIIRFQPGVSGTAWAQSSLITGRNGPIIQKIQDLTLDFNALTLSAGLNLAPSALESSHPILIERVDFVNDQNISPPTPSGGTGTLVMDRCEDAVLRDLIGFGAGPNNNLSISWIIPYGAGSIEDSHFNGPLSFEAQQLRLSNCALSKTVLWNALVQMQQLFVLNGVYFNGAPGGGLLVSTSGKNGSKLSIVDIGGWWTVNQGSTSYLGGSGAQPGCEFLGTQLAANGITRPVPLHSSIGGVANGTIHVIQGQTVAQLLSNTTIGQLFVMHDIAGANKLWSFGQPK
jgi:hypothetical protein